MFLQLLCLVAIASRVSAYGALDQRHAHLDAPRSVSYACQKSMEQCALKTMTSGKCKTTYNGFLFTWIRPDYNNDCVANGTENVRNSYENYDKNYDGKLCNTEWSARRQAINGFSEVFTRDFEWPRLAIPGGIGADNCIDISLLSGAVLETKKRFPEVSVGRLVDFCSTSNGAPFNRDCMGLPTICKEKRPDLDACTRLSFDTRTLKEKLDLHAAANDANNDGTSTIQEVSDDLNIFYDTDSDGCVTANEFVNRWTSYYRFSATFSSYSYNKFNGDSGDNCLNMDDITLPAQGVPSSTFPALDIGNLVAMCEATPSLYETDKDCAQLVDTCLTYFPDAEDCKVYVNECGPRKYIECIDSLTAQYGMCDCHKDKEEVVLENLRLTNILSDKCVPYDPKGCPSWEEFKDRFFTLFGK